MAKQKPKPNPAPAAKKPRVKAKKAATREQLQMAFERYIPVEVRITINARHPPKGELVYITGNRMGAEDVWLIEGYPANDVWLYSREFYAVKEPVNAWDDCLELV